MLSESILSLIPKFFGYIFHKFTTPLDFTYYLEKSSQEQLTDNLLKEGRQFHLFYIKDLRKREKEGWKRAIGRDEFMRPIHYYDKNKELTLMYKDNESIKIEVKVVQEKQSTLVIAWALMCLATMPRLYFDENLRSSSATFIAITLLLSLINAAYPIYALKIIRNINSSSDYSQSIIQKNINAWGYFWRSYISSYASIFIVLAIISIIPIFNNQDQYSFAKTIQFEVLYLLSISLITYFIYSKKKLALFYAVLRIFRGY